MKIKITKAGIYSSDGKMIPVGTELTVKSEPAAWKGRYEVLGEPAKDAKLVVAADKAAADKAAADKAVGSK
jgi:hypothetical protein